MASQLYPSFTKTYHHDQYPAIDPSQPSLDCSEKIIFITGGGRGIGQAIAVAFAQAHAKGIALLGRTKSTLQETEAKVNEISPNTSVFLVTADITNRSQVEHAMKEILSHFKAVPDVLVNNAGGISGRGPLIDVDIDEFWKAYELNVKGPLTVSQAFLRANRSHAPDTPRTIINIPSGAAHLPFSPGACSYGTSKLACVRIMEYLHYENPDWKVFNLQPGVVDTELARAAGRKAPDKPAMSAGMCVWLAAHPSSGELSGRFLWANWDVEELLERKEEIRSKDLLMMCLRGWGEEVGEVVSNEELIRRAVSVVGDAKR